MFLLSVFSTYCRSLSQHIDTQSIQMHKRKPQININVLVALAHPWSTHREPVWSPAFPETPLVSQPEGKAFFQHWHSVSRAWNLTGGRTVWPGLVKRDPVERFVTAGYQEVLVGEGDIFGPHAETTRLSWTSEGSHSESVEWKRTRDAVKNLTSKFPPVFLESAEAGKSNQTFFTYITDI